VAKRKQLRTRKRRNRPAPTINPNAAGIDVGATEVYVAVPTDRDSEPVRTFASWSEADSRDVSHLTVDRLANKVWRCDLLESAIRLQTVAAYARYARSGEHGSPSEQSAT